MKRVILLPLLVAMCIAANAQDFESILAQVESNNLSLKAIRQSIEAQAESNLADATLSDPELEYAYLFGPEGVRRNDISFSQAIDFATISGAKKAGAKYENQLLELEYKAARRELLLQARNLICEIVFRNIILKDLSHRLEHTREVESAYKKGLDAGEFSIIEYRKAAIDLVEAEGKRELFSTERNALLAELTALNGGIVIEVNEDDFVLPLLPASFELWLNDAAQRSSALEYIRTSVKLSESQLKLAKDEAVPGLTIGYMAELVPDGTFHGVTVGLSIPLWSSSKKISAARKQVSAAQAQADASVLEFTLKAKSLYDKALSLAKAVERYETLVDTEELLSDLDKALESGEMSLMDYVTELALYFETRYSEFSARLDYCLAYNELVGLEY